MSQIVFNVGYTLPSPPKNLKGNMRADYIARRNFYDLTAEYNYFSYALNNAKVVKNANAEHYFTREKTNSGLFNFNGALSESDIEKLKENLKNSKSIIWHGFISFDDASSKGLNTQEQAIKFMKQTFGAFLQRTHLNPKNIELYAALHDDTDHRHIHFAFFEKEPMRRNKYGNLGYTSIGKISPKAIDNYLVSANMHILNGHQYYTARDKAIDSLKNLHDMIINKREKGTPLKLNINAAICQLIKDLPPTGRLQYNSENMASLRPQIDSIVDMLITSDKDTSKSYQETMRQFARIKLDTIKLIKDNKLIYINGRRICKEDIKALISRDDINYVNLSNIDYFEKLYTDFRARMGNVVLGICKDMKSLNYLNYRKKVNNKELKIVARNKRKRKTEILSNAIKILNSVIHDEQSNYILSVRENENIIEYEKYIENKI